MIIFYLIVGCKISLQKADFVKSNTESKHISGSSFTILLSL